MKTLLTSKPLTNGILANHKSANDGGWLQIGLPCPDATFIVVFSDPNQVQAYVVWVRLVKTLTGQIQNVVDCVIDGKYKMVFGEAVPSSGE